MRALKRDQTSSWEERLAEALPLSSSHSRDPWVTLALGWLIHDRLRELAASGRLDLAVPLAALAFEALPHMPADKSPLLASCLVNKLSACMKNDDEPGTSTEHRALADLLESATPVLIGLLPDRPLPRATAPASTRADAEPPAPLLMFGYLARRVALGSGRTSLLETAVVPLVERFPRNEWLATAAVESARLRGDLDLAHARAEQAGRDFPRSVAVARVRALLAEEQGRQDEALALLLPHCLVASSPWPLRDRARVLMDLNPDEALLALEAALARHEADKPGPVWRLHFDLAKLLLPRRDSEAALTELWLAAEARALSRWEPHGAVEAMRRGFGTAGSQLWAALDARPVGEVRLQARGRYRAARERFRLAHTEPVTVRTYDTARGFGFVTLGDGREAFLHRTLLRGCEVVPGQQLRAAVAKSYDARKRREGLAVIFLLAPVGARR